MSDHVLLDLLNELGKVIKCEACQAFYHFFATSLINSIIQDDVRFYYHMTNICNRFFRVKTLRFCYKYATLLCAFFITLQVPENL